MAKYFMTKLRSKTTLFNKPLFNRTLLFSLSLLTLPLAASAETVFMVQLGSFDSEKKAASHWQSLVATFPDLFDDLNYSPNEVVMKPDNFVSYRTQAGPIPTRDEAEGICSALIRSGYECAVAETAMFYGEDKEITQAAPEYIPFAKQSDYVLPSATGAKPLIMGAPPSNLATQIVPDAPVANATPVQGTIAAGEAIPVPLSNNEPASNPYLEKGNMLMDAHPADSARLNSFWADIGYFNSEAQAAQYVKLLKQRDPILPAKLRVRITRPYGVVTGRERLSLRMGPFVTTRPILRLCGLTRADNMRCRAVKDVGGSVRNTDRYSNRRNVRDIPNNYTGYRGAANKASQNGQNLNAQYQNKATVSGAYYVQLGSFLSPDAASAKWAQLQSLHGGVLSNVKNDIVIPRQGSSASRLFRLRAGPFADMNAAYNLCGQLKAQGTLCIVVK
jgi:hypothetical protein